MPEGCIEITHLKSGGFQIRRRPVNRPDFVNLGETFTLSEANMLSWWAINADRIPRWEQWKKAIRLVKRRTEIDQRLRDLKP